MVLQGLFGFATTLAIAAVAIAGICFTVNYVQNQLLYEEPARPRRSSPKPSRSGWNGYDREEEVTCSICLYKIETDSCKLTCGHMFHKKCIAGWNAHTKQCPNCRATV